MMELTKSILTAIKIGMAIGALISQASAGTSHQRALAAVAVARAALEIADDHAELQDTKGRFGAEMSAMKAELDRMKRDFVPRPPTLIKDEVVPPREPIPDIGRLETEASVARAKLAECEAEKLSQTWQIAELKIANADLTKPSGEPPAPQSDGASVPAKSPVDASTVNGSLPELPPTGVISAVQPMRLEIASQAIQSEVMPAQLIVSKWEKGCPHCVRLEHDIVHQLKPLKWTIGTGSDNQIQFVTIPQTESVPKITLYQNGEVLETWEGYQDPAMLSNKLRAAWDSAPNGRPMQASGPAGAIHAKIQIQQAIAWAREYLGEGNRASFVWDRNGSQSINLLAGGDWSAKSVFGSNGRIQLDAPKSLKLPLKTLGFGYRIVGSDVIVDADPVTLAGMADRLSPSKSRAVGATPAGIIGIDDMLLAYNVFCMIREIFAVLHPSCDLILPDQISASMVLTGNSLVVTFDKAPTARLKWLFTFNIVVKQVTFTDSNVHVDFTGSRWVKSRDFVVQ